MIQKAAVTSCSQTRPDLVANVVVGATVDLFAESGMNSNSEPPVTVPDIPSRAFVFGDVA